MKYLSGKKRNKQITDDKKFQLTPRYIFESIKVLRLFPRTTQVDGLILIIPLSAIHNYNLHFGRKINCEKCH